MTDTKWTPGPWSRQPVWPDRPIPVAGFCISHFSKGDGGYEAEANARLIAAAPDMAEAIQEAIKCGMVPKSTAKDGGAVSHARQVQVADMLRDALAKARGDA